MNQPLVSILMPAYQAASFIRDAIASCQQQSYTNWELCIADDGSQDNTYAIAHDASLKDNRILVSRQLHAGCAAARNTCLLMSSGEIIARQDADDLQNIHRLKLQVEHLLENRNLDIVTCGMTICDTRLPHIRAAHPKLDLHDFQEGMIEAKYLQNKGGRPVCASIVTWKDTYNRVGYFNPEMQAGSDGEWNFRAITRGVQWGFIDLPLYIYRLHPGQISARLSNQQHANHEKSRRLYNDEINTKRECTAGPLLHDDLLFR